MTICFPFLKTWAKKGSRNLLSVTHLLIYSVIKKNHLMSTMCQILMGIVSHKAQTSFNILLTKTVRQIYTHTQFVTTSLLWHLCFSHKTYSLRCCPRSRIPLALASSHVMNWGRGRQFEVLYHLWLVQFQAHLRWACDSETLLKKSLGEYYN